VTRHRLLLAAAALLFSTGGLAIKANSLTAWQVTCFRSAIAALFLAAVLRRWRSAFSWRLLPVAGAYASTLVLFVQATRRTTAANAIFLQSAAPLYLILIGPLLLHERLRKRDVWVVAGVAAGLAMFFVDAEPARVTAPDPAAGNLLALFSGIAWAFTLAGLRWLGRGPQQHHAGGASVLLGNVMAALVALPWALPVGHIAAVDVAVILYIGICQIGLAYVCLTRGLTGVPAFEAATLLLLEPVLNPIWTWLLLGEQPGGWAIGGGALILSATMLNTWWSTRANE
jgi:DME family drug/metabolite transporter